MATWTNGSGSPTRVGGTHYVRGLDFTEIITAMNRRRLLVYLAEEGDLAALFEADDFIKFAPISSATDPPFDNLRKQFTTHIVEPVTGSLGGTPASPADMEWLWPVADADENKVIVLGAPGGGEVGFFDKMNGGAGWTDPALSASVNARTAHLNELRWSIETLTRGKWELPIYWSAGIISTMPNTSWVGRTIANNGSAECRCIGFAIFFTADTPAQGLQNVTVRSSSRIYVKADTACDVEIYRCKRPINFTTNRPTWNEYDPDAELAWDTAGCSGAPDRALIGSMSLAAGVENSITGATVASELQAIIDGAEQNLMIRRSDEGVETVTLDLYANRVVVEFDVDVPPN